MKDILVDYQIHINEFNLIKKEIEKQQNELINLIHAKKRCATCVGDNINILPTEINALHKSKHDKNNLIQCKVKGQSGYQFSNMPVNGKIINGDLHIGGNECRDLDDKPFKCDSESLCNDIISGVNKGFDKEIGLNRITKMCNDRSNNNTYIYNSLPDYNPNLICCSSLSDDKKSYWIPLTLYNSSNLTFDSEIKGFIDKKDLSFCKNIDLNSKIGDIEVSVRKLNDVYKKMKSVIDDSNDKDSKKSIINKNFVKIYDDMLKENEKLMKLVNQDNTISESNKTKTLHINNSNIMYIIFFIIAVVLFGLCIYTFKDLIPKMPNLKKTPTNKK